MAKKRSSTRRASRSRKARAAAAGPAPLPRPSVATVVVKPATRQPHRVGLLARPPRIDRPKRIHPRRFLPRVAEGEERALRSATPALGHVAAVAVAPGDELKIVLDTELTGPGQNRTASNVGEPSTAINGNVVLYTGNWYAATSNDGGATFKFMDPEKAFSKFDPPHKTFCCDQIAQYIPKIDTFVWLLQYSAPGDADNFQRLAFAKSGDVAAGRWRIFDITTETLGVQGAFLDFPDLAVGENALYMTTNVFPANNLKAGCAVVRIPFTSMTAGPFKVDRFVTFDNFSARVTQNCGTIAFFAAHENTSTLRVFSWDESAAQPTSRLVGVSRWIGGNGYHSRTPDGRRWLDRADSRITGATVAAGELWFAWGVNRGSNQRDKPFVQAARIDAGNLTLLENVNIFDNDSATCYAGLSTNASNEVGVAYFLGGGTRFPTLMVGILTAPRREIEVATGQRGPLADDDGSHQWGDYLTARPALPNAHLFAATGYVMKGPGSGDGSNRDCTPHFVVFGRKKHVS
jgi:hypothetical protein